MEFTEKLKELKKRQKEINKLNTELTKFSSEIFEDFYRYIFEKYNTLESFGWTQYTPYFNDGDTCVFFANTEYIKVNDDYAEDSSWFNQKNVTNWGTWNSTQRVYEGREEVENENYDKVLVDAHNEIIEFLSQFDNDFYLRKFGDHAEITVTRTGVDISDCDHD